MFDIDVMLAVTAISVLEFNKEGTHLAYGNSDGILSILELGQSVKQINFHHWVLEI